MDSNVYEQLKEEIESTTKRFQEDVVRNYTLWNDRIEKSHNDLMEMLNKVKENEVNSILNNICRRLDSIEEKLSKLEDDE